MTSFLIYFNSSIVGCFVWVPFPFLFLSLSPSASRSPFGNIRCSLCLSLHIRVMCVRVFFFLFSFSVGLRSFVCVSDSKNVFLCLFLHLAEAETPQTFCEDDEVDDRIIGVQPRREVHCMRCRTTCDYYGYYFSIISYTNTMNVIDRASKSGWSIRFIIFRKLCWAEEKYVFVLLCSVYDLLCPSSPHHLVFRFHFLSALRIGFCTSARATTLSQFWQWSRRSRVKAKWKEYKRREEKRDRLCAYCCLPKNASWRTHLSLSLSPSGISLIELSNNRKEIVIRHGSIGGCHRLPHHWCVRYCFVQFLKNVNAMRSHHNWHFISIRWMNFFFSPGRPPNILNGHRIAQGETWEGVRMTDKQPRPTTINYIETTSERPKRKENISLCNRNGILKNCRSAAQRGNALFEYKNSMNREREREKGIFGMPTATMCVFRCQMTIAK